MHIIGKVYTNLDNYAEMIWPGIFVAVPKIGSSIESNSGKRLKVVGITHCVIDRAQSAEAYMGKLQRVPYPYVKIEVSN